MKRTVLFALACLLAGWSASRQSAFEFAIIGDRTGEPRAGVYEHVWQDAAAQHPAFAINVGDTIQGGEGSSVAEEWAKVKAIWKKYPFPFFVVPGNHDIWSDASARAFERATGHPPQYSFDWENAHFTVLDNSRSDEFTPAQMRYLEDDLARNRARAPKFVVFHRPNVWLINLMLQNPDFPLHQIVHKYGVTAVISGHTHQFAIVSRDGIEYITAPSSGGHLRDSSFDRGWFFGYMRAKVKGPAVDFTVQELGPPFGKGRSFDVRDWKGGY